MLNINTFYKKSNNSSSINNQSNSSNNNDNPIRIIGIDPGSIYTGWGILDSSQFGRKIKLVSIGLIDAKKYNYPHNLGLIFNELKKIIEEYSPSTMVIESAFSGLNPSSLIKLSQTRGAICLLSSLFSINLKEYAPRYIKKNVAGYGGADKEAVRRMVYNFIKELKDINFNDGDNISDNNIIIKKGRKVSILNNNISDALSTAICYATDMSNYI
ncbi:MAG: crossover junction endodeoxyribonuclease RuvC [bacterium]